MRISVFGLGYVGTTCGVCLAELGHEVVGVDSNQAKVETLVRGESPILEPGLTEMARRAVEAGRLSATTDSARAVEQSDVAIVCVGTPSQPDGGLDLTAVLNVARDIGLALRTHRGRFLVIVRSTVLPGTGVRVAEAVRSASGKRENLDFDVCVNPEFLRENSAVHDFFHPARIVIGSADPAAAEAAKAVYRGIEAPVFLTTLGVAEMVKYGDNAFHALKVSFANEMGRLCKRLGIDSHAVMEVFCADTRLNLSPAYLKPGFAFGGSCLPKDLRALTGEARHLGVGTPLLDAVLESNELHLRSAKEALLRFRGKRLGFLGLAFKEGTDDLRESPLVELVEFALGKGFAIAVYDKNVTPSRLTGANREYIERSVPHLACLLTDDPFALVRASDVLVVGAASAATAELIEAMNGSQVLLDLVRVADRPDADRYCGIAW